MTEAADDARPTSAGREWGAVAFAALFPSAVTFVYFVWLAQDTASWQQGAYAVGKVLQFAFPVVWVALVCREKLDRRWWGRKGLWFGLLFGAADIALTLAAYYWWLKPAGYFEVAGEAIREKVLGFGITSLGSYAALAVFYSLAHSALEEYYWRWFVFGRLRRLTSLPVAIGLSSAAFAAHHVIVLAEYFGWFSWVTFVLSAGVAIGGAVWAWLYNRTGSLVGPWIAHILADVGVFLVGLDLVRGFLTG